MYKICLTEESSRRQRALERGLLEALGQQPYERITLTSLCRELDVPRKSFYRYFPTKEDCLLSLIDHTLSDCNDMTLKGWEGHGELDQAVQLRFFRFWLDRKAFLDAIQGNHLEPLLLERTNAIVDRMKSAESDSFARDQVKYFVAYGLMATVLRWHSQGFPDTPEEMAQVFGSLLGSCDISVSRLLL